ncbi:MULTISPECIES: hypothetical protein [unclassified Enterococcus]|uniref:hypothetical protein n=1 Tax=unclassified Enterococcus TaxID=2608891 RepID=UPI0015566722|nr:MULTISPECIES: hypothetical protein [unclassified Enterococcus]MBS7576309.1 hypothetical protein [Enterococcus sp. MMGLQ5-2]MBS7583542.1 hypothetical protein [Enterococcus sp. MMGLQ5-1]NPD11404.1 hypothetical protein [Enterococcus sp. MMGLQ5-1]NPD36147.1 hypothetical protein [Enterococcus sp. MMGLQ5-2]
MAKVASDYGVAVGAAAGIAGVQADTSKKTVTLSESNIQSMKDGASVNNQLLSDLSQLVSCVQAQADKFPQLAEKIALRDSQASFNAGGN